MREACKACAKPRFRLPIHDDATDAPPNNEIIIISSCGHYFPARFLLCSCLQTINNNLNTLWNGHLTLP